MKTKAFTLSLVLIIALLAAGTVFARPDNGDGEFVPVTLCHATGSATNPYVEITVDNQGAYNGHTHHDDDIIPAPAGGCPTGDDDNENENENDNDQRQPTPIPAAPTCEGSAGLWVPDNNAPTGFVDSNVSWAQLMVAKAFDGSDPNLVNNYQVVEFLPVTVGDSGYEIPERYWSGEFWFKLDLGPETCMRWHGAFELGLLD